MGLLEEWSNIMTKNIDEMNKKALAAKECEILDVERPSHYQLKEGLEVRDVINAFLNKLIIEYSSDDPLVFGHMYEYANAIKYVLRSPFKDDLRKDLEKAKFCIQTIIDSIDAK